MIGAYLDLARLHAPLLTLLVPLCGAALAFLLPGRLAWGVGVDSGVSRLRFWVSTLWRARCWRRRR